MEVPAHDAPAYDAVAALYERAFHDFTVRDVELAFLRRALAESPTKPRVLDLGAGNGALLEALAPQLAEGVGVDVAPEMLTFARRRAQHHPGLSFHTLSGPTLPFAAGSFDLVISCLSFRYLDWPRIWPEIRRVLTEGGRFVLVDLVRERATLRDGARLVRSAARHGRARLTQRHFRRELAALTRHPDWARMLERHPMRAFSEYRRFFAEALPGVEFVALDVLPSRRVVALQSGPLARARAAQAPAPRAGT